MKKVILFLLFLIVTITGSMAGTVFVVDNNGDGDNFQGYTDNDGTNTLRKCIRLANNTGNGGTPHQIVFRLATGTIIQVNSDLPAINNNGNAGGLIIDATIAPMAGYNGAPLIGIFRGNGQNGNGFNIDGANNVTIRGLAIQNFVVGIRVNNSTGSTLDKNFIGTNLAGTSIAGTTIRTNGILLDANAANTNISSNVISGCMSVGDGNFYGAINIRGGSHGVKITSNFIGTDASGSNLLGNGTNQPYRQQGIYIDGSSTVSNPIVISNNVISGNVGNGIWANNTAGLKIVGNHIGTDLGGTKAIGNKAAGIRVDKSNNVTIGGSTAADRNIISGNGGAVDSRPCGPDYCGEPCNFNACPTGYDATLQTGIYFSEVTSSKISGNYVGTNNTGASTGTDNSLGNFYAGIKLEASSSNVIIGGNTADEGNVIGGNGFGIYPNNGKAYRGHGIQLNGGSVSNIQVYNNRVGVGPNNEQIGNRQDGISLLGAHDCKIGDAASIGDLAGKGNIVGNNSWGIFLQSDFSNNDNSNQARNNSIKGNYLGNDGSVAFGNGTRALDDEGAGVGIQHGSNNNVVEFNVISGNRDGITFRGQGFGAGVANNSETTSNIIRSNYIGTDKTGKTAMANKNNGILVTEGAQYITIGGVVAGQGNIISGNTADGIHMEDGDRVKIFNNKIGVEKDGLALANGGDGIELKQSTGTTGGSSNNIIGGVNAGESNTIANNGGNGVVVDGTTSINNSIHHNSFSCNALRGIVLSNGGNNNYAKPTFSGTPTNFTVTGPANSYIEIYEIDACHNCGLDPDKVQGKTLVKSGTSPLSFVPATGKTNKDYTAIVSVNGTTAAHNTSEFTSCISLCIEPKPEITGSAYAFCDSTQNITFSTPNVPGNTYKWTVTGGLTIVGSSTETSVTINIGSTGGTLSVKELAGACEGIHSRIIEVNPRPKTPGIVGNATPCENTPGLKYNVPSTAGTTYTWTVPAGVTIVSGQGTNEITVDIGSAATASGEITVFATTDATACVDLSPSKFTIDVKPRPETPGISGNSTPCENTPGLKYSVPSTAGTTYTWTVPAGVTIVSGQGTNEITVDIGSASTASGDITVTAKTDASGCEDLSPSKFTLDVKPRPETPGIVGEANPCENSPGLKYSVPLTAGTTYTWVVPTGVTIVSGQGTNEITVDIGASADASGDITVFATTTLTSCEDLSPSKITLNVSPRPETPGIVGNDTPCENTPGLKYSVTATAGLVYNWTVPAGVTIVSGQGTNEVTVDIGPEATASGVITVYASTGSSATACSDLTPSTITLDVQPRPETPTVNGDDEVCENSSGHIYTISSVAGMDYKWTVPAGFTITSGDGTNSITVSVAEGASDGIIKVYLENSTTKCEDLSPSEFAVKVNPRPVTPGILGNAEVCEDTKDHIYSVPAVNGVDYKWSVPAGFTITSGDNTNSITVSVAAGATDGVIKVYLINQASGCEDLTPSEITIKVNTLPVLTLTPDANEICEGSSTVLKTVVTGGNGAVTYNWTATPGPNPSGESPTVSPADTTIYTLIITDAKGCSADTQSVQIDVNENPVLVISTTVNDSICKGTSAILSTNITKGNKPYISLVWTANPAPVPSQDDFNPSVSPTVTTDYTATVTDSKNCKATDGIKITVIDVPDGPLSANVDRSVICNTDTRNIELSATVGTDPKIRPIWYKQGCGLDSVTTGYTVSITPPDSTTTYYIALKNVCGISECKSVNVKVNKDPKDDLIDALVSEQSICSAYAGAIELSVDTIYNPDAVINWYMKDKDLKDSIIGHGNPYKLPKNPKDTTYYYVYLYVEACLPSPVDSVPVNVIDPKVDAGGVIGDKYVYCRNEDKAFVFGSVRPAGVDWKWVPENPSAPVLFDPARLVSQVNTKSPAETQKWYLIADNKICKPVIDSMYLTIHDLPVVTLDIPQDTLCSKVEFDAVATVVKGVPNAYVWLTPNSSMPDTSYVMADHTNPLTKRFTAEVAGRNYFLVTVVDTNGCWAELPAIDSVEIFDHQELVIPNLMTPNHDGKNETYIIRDINNYDILPGAKLEVYNRWGERVYRNSSYDNSWDAANISDGVYYYYLKTGCAKDEYKGWLHIISNNNRNE